MKGTLVMGDAPSAVAIGVPAPGTKDALFAPFLVLAARLIEKGGEGGWQASYEPIARPELLLITGSVGTERGEPAAERMRREAEAVVGRELSAEDVAKTKERFALLLDPELLDPGLCAKDPRAFGVARARRAQMEIDGTALAQAVEGVTKDQLAEAGKAFGAKQSAAIIAGGKIE
ncbi:MAG: hypothetical protein R3F14_01785 [Polyangiaceae bacterium]